MQVGKESPPWIQQQPTFDPKQLEPGAVVRVTSSKLFPAVRNSYAWNALLLKVEPFEITVARLQSGGDRDYENGTAKQSIHIEAILRGDATLELLREA